MDIAHDLARSAKVGEDLSGADVVVLAGEADLDAVRTRAPAAVVVVTGEGIEDRCTRVYGATLFPRARIVGLADLAQIGPAVESILFERDGEHDVVAMADGRFGARRARLGRGGIRALL